ncbi:MAG: hypothetical protein SNJ85_13745 [Cyanobacteriota bacterium]
MTWLPRLPAKCGSVEAIDSTLNLEGRPLPPSLEGIPTSLPRPILTLQGLQATLYVELIQASLHNPRSGWDTPYSTRPGRPSGSTTLLWVRPLLLKQGSQVWNLRCTADLLWPANRFMPAYAEEFLPLLEQARDPEGSELSARQLLQEFLRQAWERPD